MQALFVLSKANISADGNKAQGQSDKTELFKERRNSHGALGVGEKKVSVLQASASYRVHSGIFSVHSLQHR